MTVAQRHVAQQYAGRGGPSGLADVLEVLLDKGLVIDAYVRVSLIGIELLTIDVRVVVASVDTYLRFAEATNRLDLTNASNAQTLGELVGNDSPRGRRPRDEDDEDDEDGQVDDRSSDEVDDRSSDEAATADDDAPDDDDDGDDDGGDDDGGDDDDGGSADDEQESGPGVLSRIKQRGQAF